MAVRSSRRPTLEFWLVLTFANFCSAIWLMIFGRPGRRLEGLVLMIVLALNVIYSIFGRNFDGVPSFGQTMIQAISLILFVWLSMIGKSLWPIIISAIQLLRLTLLALIYLGIEVPEIYTYTLRAMVWILMPIMILSGELLANSKKAMWWTKR